jgi:hypothetical protein
VTANGLNQLTRLTKLETLEINGSIRDYELKELYRAVPNLKRPH